MAPLSNLPEPDPCDGPPLVNRPLGFPGTISNLPQPAANCCDGILFAFTGTGFGFDLLQQYDPKTDTWTELTNYPKYPDYLFTSKLWVSRNGQNIFYLAQDQNDFFDHVVRSFDGGATWEVKSVPNDRALRFTVGPDAKFYVFSTDGIYTSVDFGDTWTFVLSVPTIILNFIPAIMADVYNANKVIAVYGVHTSGPSTFAELHALVSTDGGSTWSGYQVDSFSWTAVGGYCEIQWLKNGRIVLAFARTVNDSDTTTHIFYSDDAGASWNETTTAYFTPNDSEVIDNKAFFYVAKSSDGFVLRTDGGSPDELDGITGGEFGSISKIASTVYMLEDTEPGNFFSIAKGASQWTPAELTAPGGSGLLSHGYNAC